MIHGLKHSEFVLSVLSDGRPHFSREFVQGESGECLLLEYRKRISELRRQGFGDGLREGDWDELVGSWDEADMIEARFGEWWEKQNGN